MDFWYGVFHLACWVAFHLFFRIRVIGRERIPAGPAIICSNHTSNWDTVFLTVAFGRKAHLRFTPKHTMKRIPILGRAMNLVKVIWIDRTKSGDPAPIRQMIAAVTDDGDKLVLFPEGHRVRSGDAEAAKTGAIMVASRSGAAVVPTYIPARKRLFSRITIIVGEPYVTGRVSGSEARRLAAEDLMARIRTLEI